MEALIKRGEASVEAALHEVAELRRTDAGHLVSALENEAALMEALVVDLKIQVHELNKTHAVHHIHVIEEDMLRLENRISEELANIHEHQRDHHHQGHSVAELIARAEELIGKAKATIEAHPHSREAHAIEAEMFHLEELVTALKAKPTGADLKKDEEQLARTTKTIEKLLARMADHH